MDKMKEFICVLLFLEIFAVFSKGADLCQEKKCTGQGQICVMNRHNQAECKCRESCPRSSSHARVCGSDGITYHSQCQLDMTSCRLALTDPITMVSRGRCQDSSLKVSAAHQLTQTLLSGKRGAIHCGIEGKAAQVLWRKIGMKRHFHHRRVLSLNRKTLHFREVLQEDAGIYECRAYSGSASVTATVTVVVVDPVTMDTNVASTHICHLEKLIGTGTNFTTSWYFDKNSANCHRFLYSGAGGNENNFESKLLCLRKCSHAAGDICSLPKHPGLCMGYFPRWFYNTKEGICESFIYGGCNENANNFKTKQECEQSCSAEHICGLAPQRGPCKAYLPRYFFNKTSEQCHKFIYGGCQGNSNNFPTLELCQQKCQKQVVANQTIKVKPGRCPWQRSPPIMCITSQKDTCQSDEECKDNQKCCQFGCGKTCILPVSENKPGKCPRVSQNKQMCNKKGDMCNKDPDCPGTRKCCFNGCQRDCSVPEALERVKPGACPGMNAINPLLCKNTKNECKQDEDCFGRLKCCFNGCYKECVKRPMPTPKPGVCPLADYIPPENCSDKTDKCIDDVQCPGRGKCCFTGCLQECITPPAVKKPGLCPVVDYLPPEQCEVHENECDNDNDCKDRDKCCDTSCIKECITPPIVVKPGECPILDFISPELCEVTEDECDNDNDCKGRDKCCATGCIKGCVTPPQVNIVKKDGQCPKPWKGGDGICDRRGDMCDHDFSCNGTAKCCFNGCQKDCIVPIPVTKVGFCPKPWKGQDGICDRRGDMCSVDIDCEGSRKCCFNGCQHDCVKPSTRELSERPGQCPNPWKEQPCDKRGDKCDADDDCWDSGHKCCFNGCQKDCTKPVNLTKCQEETLAALDKLAEDPPLLSVFVPRCKPDGQYEDQQCHELYCWCVDKDGEKIPDTAVIGSAMCLPQAKPGKCPKPWKGQEGICDNRGDMCHQDSDCTGDERCCFNGCQYDCLSPVGIKLCKKHLDAQTDTSHPPAVGAFVPSCKMNGDYEEIQCHGSTGFCWCVDKLGNELPGTRVRGEPNCTGSASQNGAGKEGKCPKPWKGLTGFCDKMGDQCGMDYLCVENEKCCFSGCQRMCVNTTEAHKKGASKPGQCPKPWLGQEGLCDRRGDMCLQDVDCRGSQICCFNGCQNDCVNPGLSTCQKRYEESYLFPPLGRFVPRCKKDGRFHEMQCHPSTGHCWCVDSYGTEVLGTRTRGSPNCTVPDPCASTTCPYYGECVPSKDLKSVECKCNIACVFIYDPVCGTDGHTYSNECVMKSTACLQKKIITVAYGGECEKVNPCATVKCGFYSDCDIVNGSFTCVCPGSGSHESCSDEKKPVCGSDGNIYDNICHLMNTSCQQQALIQPAVPEKCEEHVDVCVNVTCSHPLQECKLTDEGNPVCECKDSQHVCTSEYAPVCGTDGKTYSNKCRMDTQTCEENKIVFVDYQGECKEGHGNFSELCSHVNCSHHLARCRVTNKTATCVCPNIMTMEYNPICGSDGVTYPSPGALGIASCESGGAVSKRHNGECFKLADPCEVTLCSHKRHRCEVENGTAVCVCNMACTLEYVPVCASDNKTYPNYCAVEVAACESGESLRVIKPGKCDGIAANVHYVCPQPWKGHDGICDRRGDMCQSNADCEVQGGGKCCFNGCQNDCIQFGALNCSEECHPNAQCFDFNGVHQCVCNRGFEGNGIECAADPCSVKKCEHYGVCTESNGVGKCVCPKGCPRIFAPVCGSDGNVYDNECLMRMTSCEEQKKITLASKETCKPDPCKKSKCSHPLHICIKTSNPEGAVCICPPSACTKEYEPVCGSDGKTYPNACALRQTACERSQNITLASQGECEEEENENACDVPGLCTHPHHQCQLVGSTAMCMCPMIIPANLDPVCGTDGQTYPNAQALESMSCLANRVVQIQYEGHCIVPSDPCDISLCSHPRHYCKVVEGSATCVCNEICPLILLPVCGSDGQSYPNICTLEVEACATGKELTIVSLGECDKCENKACPDPRQYCKVVNSTAMCVCNEICTADWSPVCGSDGITYPNECILEVKACKTGKRLGVVKPGECGTAGQCPVLNPSPVCSEEPASCHTGNITCASNMTCCLDNDCHHKCTLPTVENGVRPGYCPVLKPIPACAADITGCTSDDQCSLGKRCCLQQNCTKKCVEAETVPPPSPLLTCPVLDPTPLCELPPDAEPNCFMGGPECPVGEACCLDMDCNHKCVKPALPDGSRPGECPASNPMPACESTPGCRSDKMCALGKRCCLQSNCTKICIKTDVPPPPLPPGQLLTCPVLDPTPLCELPPDAEPNCFTGGPECPVGEACCLDMDCNHKCVKPALPDGSRPGECPVPNPMPSCESTRGCRSDTMCALGERCCLQSNCSKMCVKTDVPLPPTPHNKPSKPACDPPCHRYANCIKDHETGEHKCSCARACPRWYAPVCGTDGVTYSTECMLMFLVCEKGTDVGVEHPGKCEKEKKDHCPSLNPMPTCLSITGCSNDSECSDGEKCCLRRDCTMKCSVLAKPGQCPVIKRKPCPPILRPSNCTTDFDCVGDLKCCSEGCGIRRCSSIFLKERNPCELTHCGYPHTVCAVLNGKATCLCRQECTQPHDDLVCGSDGRTYGNMCLLEVTACKLEDGGMPPGKLTYVGNGECTVPQICSLPAETGRCRASMSRFFFNATSRKCEEFRFGGCEGNANRFDTEKECNDFCGALDACQLNPCPDPYAICNISASGDRKCSCPQICTADHSPVCGTDRQTYSNECQMKVAACSQGMMVKVKSQGECRNNPGYCPAVDPGMCSFDREDLCFDDTSCKPVEKCCHDGCRKICLRPLPRSNAAPHRQAVPQLLTSGSYKVPSLEDLCKNCKFPRTVCRQVGNGVIECQCPQECTEEFAPVCGSDGHNYSNGCKLKVKACKPENNRTLRVKHLGPCVCDLPPAGGLCFGYIPRYFFNATTKRCERFIYGGCQGNGNNFETVKACEDLCISPCKNFKCPFPRTRCEVEEGLPVCKCPIVCPADYRPVCGTDGKTYGNMCGLEAAACQTKHFRLKLAHLGECLSVNPCDGFVCSHKRHSCVAIGPQAVCVCSSVCTREYDPYCASDGITYPNKCNLEVAECESGKTLAVLHAGKCTADTPSSDDPCLLHKCPFHGVCRVDENGDPMCECVTDCPNNDDPVCGSDGKNYSSECVLKAQACQTKTFLHVVGGPAKCTSKRLRCKSCPARSNLFTHFCEADFVIEGTLEDIQSPEGDGSSVIMAKVTGVFKGSDAMQNKIIKIDFSENLNSCYCKELRLKKAVVIAGSTTNSGGYFLGKSSSFVRHSGKRLLEKVQQRTKLNKCNKIRKPD